MWPSTSKRVATNQTDPAVVAIVGQIAAKVPDR
jgi:hypothetical protein